MVAPKTTDTPYKPVKNDYGAGIGSAAGSLVISEQGVLTVLTPDGRPVTHSANLGSTNTTTPLGFNTTVSLSCFDLSSNQAQLYGRGAGPTDDLTMTAAGRVTPRVANRATYVPYYYSTDGYGMLAVVEKAYNTSKGSLFPATYEAKGGTVQWCADGALDLYFMPAETLEEGTKEFYSLTGGAAVPPKYAFGFTASRWGWGNRTYIQETLEHFRTGNFPIDAFIVDFEWYSNTSDYDLPADGYDWFNDFGWHNETFPDPVQQLVQYKEDYHVRFAGIRKPRYGNSDVLKFAKSKGWILPQGEPAGDAPGPPDQPPGYYAQGRQVNYSNPEARAWYAEHMAHYTTEGVDFWWNDEGETDFYTFHWWNVAQQDAMRSVDPSRRFYTLNRAFTPGTARIGAAYWTGDVNPTWTDLLGTPGMMLNWGLAGAPFVTCDIGGFTNQTNAQLLTRWYQVGIFLPLMRVHSTETATPHWPWLWGPEPEAAMRGALELRYRLLPYHYSLAHHQYETGSLWMRPMVMDYGSDAKAAQLTTQWMDGDLLVAPVLYKDNHKSIYLPNGTWYEFNTTNTMVGPQTITGQAGLGEVPVYVRAGGVVAVAPVIQYSDALPGGPLEIQVYAGADGSFTLVEDDGETTAYEQGATRHVRFAYNDSAKELTWSVQGAANGPVTVEVFFTLFAGGKRVSSPPAPVGTGGSLRLQPEEILVV